MRAVAISVFRLRAGLTMLKKKTAAKKVPRFAMSYDMKNVIANASPINGA